MLENITTIIIGLCLASIAIGLIKTTAKKVFSVLLIIGIIIVIKGGVDFTPLGPYIDQAISFLLGLVSNLWEKIATSLRESRPPII